MAGTKAVPEPRHGTARAPICIILSFRACHVAPSPKAGPPLISARRRAVPVWRGDRGGGPETELGLSTDRTGDRQSHHRDGGDKERAEKEEEQLAQTLKRMFARLSGPPGAGNAALAEFQETHRDADQLNDLLREKGCTTYAIGVDDPAFLKR